MAALKTGDVLVSAVGAPYDTLLGVIGVVDKGHGSLKITESSIGK